MQHSREGYAKNSKLWGAAWPQEPTSTHKEEQEQQEAAEVAEA